MTARRRFRLALVRRTRDTRLRDVDAELRFHIAERVDELGARGMARPQAEAQARARFGDVAGVRAECEAIDAAGERTRSRREWWGAAARQVRLAARALARRPAFAMVAIGTLALGIGAATAVFSLVHGVLLRPLPFPEPERLLAVTHTTAVPGVPEVQQSDAGFLLYERHATAFERTGVHRVTDVNLVAPSGGAMQAERLVAAGVSAGLFPTLRATALRGRTFVAGEDRRGARPVVVLSEGLWRRRFGGDPSVVGRQVLVDGSPREVVGIMPARFRYPTASTQLWYPLPFDAATASPGNFNFTQVARLKPGVTPERAVAELARLLPRVIEEYPGDIPPAMWAQARLAPAVAPLREAIVGRVRGLLWVLLGGAGLVLLIACANVASLFLVRAEEGQRELAVRSALGAGRAAAAQYLAEAAVVGVLGSVGGVALAVLGVRLLRALPSGVDLPRLSEVGVDGTVLLFALGAAAFATLAASALPLLRARGVPVAAVLRDAGRAATAGVRRQSARKALVVAQVALALVLVAASGLMARSFARLRDVAPGFEPARVLAVRIALPPSSYRDAASVARLYDRLLRELDALPGVQHAALTSWLPLSEDHNNGTVFVEDRPVVGDAVPPVHEQVHVSRDWFATVGTPLLAGRTFAPHDPARASTEVIVSRAFAERYWPGQRALGKRVRAGLVAPWLTVVGVVGDVHLAALDRPAEEALYLPYHAFDRDTAWAPTGVTLALRAAGDPAALVAAVRRTVHALDPAVPTYDERPMADTLRAAAARTRFTTLLLGIASAVALLLGAVGMYGVMAYGVSLRQREIGVRLALGARPLDVGRMISRQGVALAAAGVAIGLAGALAVTRFLRGLLYGVSPTDPPTLAATCALLLAVALVASWLPARRAAALPPVEALRRD